MQAWLECNDLFIRAKNELYERALLLFDEELKNGSIAVNGRFVKFEEPEMQDEDEYMMLSMLNSKEDMIEFFAKAQNSANPEAKQKVAAFVERLNNIEKLVALSKVFDEWADDALLDVNERSADDLIIHGIDGKPLRKEAISALLNIEKGRAEGESTMSKEELEMLRSAVINRESTA